MKEGDLLNGIFVLAVRDDKKKVYVGTFTDMLTIEDEVRNTLDQKGLSQYARNVFMVLGAETYQLKL